MEKYKLRQYLNVVHLETAFGNEKAHGYESLASVLARPQLSKPYPPHGQNWCNKKQQSPTPSDTKGAKTLSNPHECAILARAGGVGVSIDRCINEVRTSMEIPRNISDSERPDSRQSIVRVRSEPDSSCFDLLTTLPPQNKTEYVVKMYSPIEGKFNTLLRERIEHWRNAKELYEDSTHRRHPSKKDFDLWLSVKFRINVSLSSNDFFVGNLRMRTSRKASMIRKQIELVRTLVYRSGIEISFPRPRNDITDNPLRITRIASFLAFPNLSPGAILREVALNHLWYEFQSDFVLKKRVFERF